MTFYFFQLFSELTPPEKTKKEDFPPPLKKKKKDFHPPPLKKQNLKKIFAPLTYKFLDTRRHGGIRLVNMVMGVLRTCRLGARKGQKRANWSGQTGQRAVSREWGK